MFQITHSALSNFMGANAFNSSNLPPAPAAYRMPQASVSELMYFSKLLNSTRQSAKVWLSSSKVHFMHFTRNFACKNITNSCLVIPFSCLWPITMGRKSLKKMANKGCAGSSQIVTISYAADQSSYLAR